MKNSTYLTLSGYVRTYQHLKATVLLAFFSLSILPAFAQESPPVEVRLQPGETAVRQITVANPTEAAVNFQTNVKETSASLARRTIAPTSFDGLNVAFSTGFEDYTLGDLGNQQGWVDRKTEPYENFFIGNNIPVEASINTTAPLSGEKHLIYEWVDTTEVYFSISPQVEPEQTSPVRSVVYYIRLTGNETEYRLFTFERNLTDRDLPPTVASAVVIEPRGFVRYFEYDPTAPGNAVRVATPFIVSSDDGYVEVKYVMNRITNTFDLYLDGQRVAEKVNTRTGVVDGIAVQAANRFYRPFITSPGSSLYLDDLTIADGDASAPGWISTSTATGTLPAQGESTLDVAINAQNLAPGTYEAEVKLLDEVFGSVTTVPVTLVVEEPLPTVVNKLNLTSMCSDDPETSLRWRIRNPNNFDVEVAWQVYGTAQRDTVMAPPGDSFFFTQTNPGANTTIIRWKNEEGRTKQKIKASGKAACAPENARVASNPKLKVYPTPVSDQLNVAVEGTTGGALSIYDQTGRVVYRGSISPDSPLQLNAQVLQLQPRRLYVVSVQTPTQRVVRKIMME